MRGAAVLLALLAAGPALAEEARPLDVEAIRGCLDIAGNGAAGCVGRVSEPCQAEAGGATTLGITGCEQREAAAWDVLLNEEYRATRAWAEAADRAEAEYAPEFAVMAEALRDAQRAWIAYRDAECALDYARWGSGSMRHVAAAGCVLDMTAARAVELRDMREEY